MDLLIDSNELEVKTIISSSENSKESVQKFANTVKDKFEYAQGQFQDKGILAIAPWSVVINNISKEYYAGMYSFNIPDLTLDKTILVISGETAFQDYYGEFPTNQIVTSTHFFGNTGFDYVHPMSYLESVRRKGFPVSRGGSPQDLANAGLFYFQTG